MKNYLVSPAGDVVLVLSRAEAEALNACADEGAAGLLTDASSARSYIGGPANVAAARRALDALGHACAVARAAAPASKLRRAK